jgi:predicted Co/Zn/Cd cation transporter (cation efflux family)
MSSNPQRFVWRRVSAVLVALIGVYFLSSAVGPLIDGFRSRHIEFMHNIPIFIVFTMFLFAVGLALLFGARRLWRRPTS